MVVYSVLEWLLILETCAVCNILAITSKTKGTVYSFVVFFCFFLFFITYVSLFLYILQLQIMLKSVCLLKEKKTEKKNMQYWHKNEN